MAHIKIPYTYTSYSFSEKATKYSQRMATGAQSWGWPAAWAAVLIMVVVLNPLRDSVSSEALEWLILLSPLVFGVVAWIWAERLRKRYFLGKIRKALEEDLARIAESDPARAAAYRMQLQDILQPK